MEKLKCYHCGFDGDHKIAFKFFAPDLERIAKGQDIVPRFSIKCVCGDCGKYIKFLKFKDNLQELDDKFVDY